MKADQQENIYDDLLFKLESQIKKAESEIKIRQGVALMKIKTIIETAASVKEIIKFEKQYEATEKKFNEEIISHREEATKNFISELNKLIKHLKKVKSRCN